jgi:hypothetical protein
VDSPLYDLSAEQVKRLGVACLLHSPCDLLIIDDYFGSGEFHFREKVFSALLLKAKQSSTVVLSSDVALLSKFTDRVQSLPKLNFSGGSKGGDLDLDADDEQDLGADLASSSKPVLAEVISLNEVLVNGEKSHYSLKTLLLKSNESVEVKFSFSSSRPFQFNHFLFICRAAYGREDLASAKIFLKNKQDIIPGKNYEWTFNLTVPYLNGGNYGTAIYFKNNDELIFNHFLKLIGFGVAGNQQGSFGTGQIQVLLKDRDGQEVYV